MAIYCNNTSGNTPGKISHFQFPNQKTESKRVLNGIKAQVFFGIQMEN